MRLTSLVGAFVLGMADLVAAEPVDVDIQLLAAADASDSMQLNVGKLQRDGYVAALRSPELFSAIKRGRNGRIAFAYLEWGDSGRINIVVPWTLIGNRRDMLRIADRLERHGGVSYLKTSISHALMFGWKYFEENNYVGHRVIDVSGNGPNNQGRRVTDVRDLVVADGVTINGLPILSGTRQPRGVFGTGFDLRKLDLYYTHCVAGGSGSFVLPVLEPRDITDSVRLKMIYEISRMNGGHLLKSRALPAQVLGIQFRPPSAGQFQC